MFRIETERLIIRDMTLEDEAEFVAISQDVKYQRFYEQKDCESSKYRELTHLFVEQAQENPRKAFQLAVEIKQTREFIGTVCLRLEPANQASMGCGLSRFYQGRNLMQEAAIAIANFGFTELKVERIYAETISENSAAIRLCEQLGMRRETLMKEHRYFKDRWWDTLVLSMHRSDWKIITHSNK